MPKINNKNKINKSHVQKPYMCLNMIVKNEAHIIQETLNSVYKYINYYVISDTGSTDKTKEIIKSFFDSKNIPGEIFDDSWKNFGYNRSLALIHCKNKSDYILIIDADDLLVTQDSNFNLKNLTLDCYSVNIGKDFTYKRRQIFKNFKDYTWKYIGVLHEYPTCNKPNFTCGDINYDFHIESRRLGDRSRDTQKYQKDALVLEKALLEEPKNSRYVFYLAQSYKDCQQYEISIINYKKRVLMKGYDEEIYYSYFMIGVNMMSLKCLWPDCEKAYLDAFAHSPHRVEPIYNIANYYISQKDYEKAYEFTSIGIKIKYPEHSQLFVSKYIYDWKMLDDHAVVCYLTHKLREAYTSFKKLYEENKYDKSQKIRIGSNLVTIKAKLEEQFKKDSKAKDLNNNYKYYPGQDSFGNDLFYYPDKTVDELKVICKLNKDAIAFNSLGYVKSKIVDEKEFISIANISDLNCGLYVKLDENTQVATVSPTQLTYLANTPIATTQTAATTLTSPTQTSNILINTYIIPG